MYLICIRTETIVVSRARHVFSAAGPLHRIRVDKMPQADPAKNRSDEVEPDHAIGAGYTL